MIFHKHLRRYLALALVILGGILIFLAPDDAWIGAVLAAVGFCVELAGLILSHRKGRQRP